MADYTLTRYLKLKIAADLSADARYNLQRIDTLGATFAVDNTADLLIRSIGNIFIEPESPDVGGVANSGTIYLGNNSNSADILAYSNSFKIKSPLSLPSSTNNYLNLASIQGQSNDYTLTISTGGDNRSIVFSHSGEVVTEDGAQTLTNKGIDATANTLTNIRDDNIASGATIADTKLATISTSGKVANSATTATSSNIASTIVARDASGNFTAGTITATSFIGALTGNVTGNVSGSAASFTGTLAGNVTGTQSATVVASVGGKTSAQVSTSVDATLAATSSNSPSTIVKRDASGNFSAGTITASLTGNVTGNVSGTASNITDTSNSTLTTLSSLSLPGSQVSGNIPGNAANITGVTNSTLTSLPNLSLPVSQLSGTLPITSGGTGATTKETAQAAILPSYSGKSLAVLRVNLTETGIEWVTGAGAGVTSVSASSPLTITGDPAINPTVNIPAATSIVNGYLSSTDWSTFNSKEPAIAAGTSGQYWRGDKTWQTLNTSAVTEGTNLYFTDGRAQTAAVVDSTSGSETNKAPSVSSMKAYVTSQGGGATAYTWATVDGATKSITHSLNKTTVSVTIYDENGEDILVDTVDRTSNNAVTLTSSTAPTGNWTVVIRP